MCVCERELQNKEALLKYNFNISCSKGQIGSHEFEQFPGGGVGYIKSLGSYSIIINNFFHEEEEWLDEIYALHKLFFWNLKVGDSGARLEVERSTGSTS